jgi:hypothetical protein
VNAWYVEYFSPHELLHPVTTWNAALLLLGLLKFKILVQSHYACCADGSVRRSMNTTATVRTQPKSISDFPIGQGRYNFD